MQACLGWIDACQGLILLWEMLIPRIIYANSGMLQGDAKTRNNPEKNNILGRYRIVGSIYFPCSFPTHIQGHRSGMFSKYIIQFCLSQARHMPCSSLINKAFMGHFHVILLSHKTVHQPTVSRIVRQLYSSSFSKLIFRPYELSLCQRMV